MISDGETLLYVCYKACKIVGFLNACFNTSYYTTEKYKSLKTLKKQTYPCLCFLILSSDMSIHNVNVSTAETGRIIDEALELRKKRQALLVQEREPDLKLIQPIPFFTNVIVFSVCNGFI